MDLHNALQNYAKSTTSGTSESHQRIAAALADELKGSRDAKLAVNKLDDAAIKRIARTADASDREEAREVLEAIRNDYDPDEGDTDEGDTDEGDTDEDDTEGDTSDTEGDTSDDTDSKNSDSSSAAERAAAASQSSNIVRSERQLPSWPVLAGLALGVLAIVVGLIWFLNRSDAPQSDATRAEPTADKFLSPKADGAAMTTTAGDVYVVEAEPTRWVRVWRGSKEDNALATQAAVSAKNVIYLLDDGTVRRHRLGTGAKKDKWVWKMGESGDGPKAIQVAVTHQYLLFATDDGAVHVQNLSDEQQTISEIHQGAPGDAALLTAGGNFAYVVDDDRLMQIDLADPAKTTEMKGGALDGPIKVVRARGTTVVTLSQSGLVRVLDAEQPEAEGSLVWDGTGFTSTVNDVALTRGAFALLFEDGTVRVKSQKAEDPGVLGRLAWKKTDDHPGAESVGAKGDLVVFEVEGSKARSFDTKAKKGERLGVFYNPVNDIRPETFATHEP